MQCHACGCRKGARAEIKHFTVRVGGLGGEVIAAVRELFEGSRVTASAAHPVTVLNLVVIMQQISCLHVLILIVVDLVLDPE